MWTPHQKELWDRKKINDEHTWEWYTNFVGQRMQHNYWEYNIIGQILDSEANPQIGGILEIGTGCGGLTMLLGLWGLRLGIPVATFEIKSSLYSPIEHVLENLEIEIYTMDCFSEAGKFSVEKFIKNNNPIYLICDGGDKPKEIKAYANKLEKESLISGHDWETEVFPEDIEPFMEREGFEPWKKEQWTEKNTEFATWKKVR